MGEGEGEENVIVLLLNTIVRGGEDCRAIGVLIISGVDSAFDDSSSLWSGLVSAVVAVSALTADPANQASTEFSKAV